MENPECPAPGTWEKAAPGPSSLLRGLALFTSASLVAVDRRGSQSPEEQDWLFAVDFLRELGLLAFLGQPCRGSSWQPGGIHCSSPVALHSQGPISAGEIIWSLYTQAKVDSKYVREATQQHEGKGSLLSPYFSLHLFSISY